MAARKPDPVRPEASTGWKTLRTWLIPIIILGTGIVVLVAVGWQSNPTTPPDDRPAGPAPEGMVWIPGGTYWMGDESSPDQDAPLHEVTVTGFWMDQYEVTNAQFAKFVQETNYVTTSEQAPDPKQYPGALPENLVPGSAMFVPKECPADPLLCDPIWWEYRKGANWRHPEGPASTIEGRENHPVVHITWDDAVAYARWAGKRLPTEAEWERAARGGLDRKMFVWGNDPQGTAGQYFANTYQGKFPETLDAKDGYAGLAPVGSFAANGYGLYDMSGNAWEWCADWYSRNYYRMSPKVNPPGPEQGDIEQASGLPQRVRRGGSYLCADSYCRRYLPGTRDKNPADSSACHTGFRCVMDAAR